LIEGATKGLAPGLARLQAGQGCPLEIQERSPIRSNTLHPRQTPSNAFVQDAEYPRRESAAGKSLKRAGKSWRKNHIVHESIYPARKTVLPKKSYSRTLNEDLRRRNPYPCS
jgi:hypothetical protein